MVPSVSGRDAVKAGDTLHWTGLQQNWNFMCADCHSTNLRKGYDATAREFRTSWTEIGVGCEAGSQLIRTPPRATRNGKAAITGLTARLDERKGIAWSIDPSAGVPAPGAGRPIAKSRCARCHSRRSQITDDTQAGDSLENAFRPNVLEPALFHPDGQEEDEVYSYASFLQSKMYTKGVTCSDCHDPHTGSQPLRTRSAPNAISRRNTTHRSTTFTVRTPPRRCV